MIQSLANIAIENDSSLSSYTGTANEEELNTLLTQQTFRILTLEPIDDKTYSVELFATARSYSVGLKDLLQSLNSSGANILDSKTPPINIEYSSISDISDVNTYRIVSVTMKEDNTIVLSFATERF